METGYRDRDESIDAEDDYQYHEDKMDFFNKMPFRFKRSTVLAMQERLSQIVGTGTELDDFLLDKSVAED